MRWLALLLVGACTPEAGSDCPPVPQVGQPCSKEGIACLYGSSVGRCTEIPEYKCQNGRWVQTMSPPPQYCANEAGTNEAGTNEAGTNEAGSEAGEAGAEAGPKDATSED